VAYTIGQLKWNWINPHTGIEETSEGLKEDGNEESTVSMLTNKSIKKMAI
jgi:hypothetical protein